MGIVFLMVLLVGGLKEVGKGELHLAWTLGHKELFHWLFLLIQTLLSFLHILLHRQ